MSKIQFTRAIKPRFLKMTLEGLPGTGKTFSALSILTHLTDRIAVLDTENGRAGEYIGEETKDGVALIYDTCVTSETSPERVIEAIHVAEQAGYGAVVIDSFSSEWGALLQEKDEATRKNPKQEYTIWGKLSPRHARVITAINAANLHVILTIRAKIGHEMVTVESEGGKKSTEVVEIGLQPIQRPETPYEFSFRGIIDREHDLTFMKSPCPELFEQTINRPGKEVATILKAWLAKGGQLTPAEELKRLCRLKGYSDLALAKWLAQFWSVEQADLSDMLSNAQPDQIQTAVKKFLDVRVNGAL
ncbi:MAG: ATP-binding protein [Acidobacteria bacterium]|nr:ATP-binding protein [Acidobacteriota bacterium]